MDLVEMDFERILKTHYFLFTSSSSLCVPCNFSKSFLVQWLRLLALDWLIVGSNPGLAIFFISQKEQKIE